MTAGQGIMKVKLVMLVIDSSGCNFCSYSRVNSCNVIEQDDILRHELGVISLGQGEKISLRGRFLGVTYSSVSLERTLKDRLRDIGVQRGSGREPIKRSTQLSLWQAQPRQPRDIKINYA